MLMYGCSQSTSDPGATGGVENGVGVPLVVAPVDNKNNITFAGNTQLPSGKIVDYTMVEMSLDDVPLDSIAVSRSDVLLVNTIRNLNLQNTCAKITDAPTEYKEYQDEKGMVNEIALINFLNYDGDFSRFTAPIDHGFLDGFIATVSLTGLKHTAKCETQKRNINETEFYVSLSCIISDLVLPQGVSQGSTDQRCYAIYKYHAIAK